MFNKTMSELVKERGKFRSPIVSATCHVLHRFRPGFTYNILSMQKEGEANGECRSGMVLGGVVGTSDRGL